MRNKPSQTSCCQRKRTGGGAKRQVPVEEEPKKEIKVSGKIKKECHPELVSGSTVLVETALILSLLLIPTMTYAQGADPDVETLKVPTLDKLHTAGTLIPGSEDKDADGNPIDGTAKVYPESGYTLTEIPNADPNNLPNNTITKYEIKETTKYYDPATGAEVQQPNLDPNITYKQVQTKEIIPHYYTVALKQTEYGTPNAENAVSHYYKWQTTDGKTSLVEGTASDHTLTYYEDPTKTAADRITTDQGGADIDANFIGNHVEPSGVHANGGAIYNEQTIGNITGDFVTNYASSSNSYSYAYGGAIYNGGTIGNITGNFIGNYAVNMSQGSSGGAIYNRGELAKIGDITGNFIGNYAYSSNSFAFGGAIYNDGTIENITGDFVGNYAQSSYSYAYGGAILNDGTIENITGDFIGNYASGYSAYGGAILNEGTIGTKDADGNVIGGIINSSFINNYAKAETTHDSAKALGGAIYSNNNINIIADNGTSLFSGNKTITTINKGTDTEQTTVDENAIYMATAGKTLTLKSLNNGHIQFDDKIDGVSGYNLSITGDNTGKVILKNNVDNAKISLENTNLYLGKDDVFNNSVSLTLNSGSLSMVNGQAGELHLPTFILKGNTNFSADVNLAEKTMDRITAETYDITEGAMLNVNNLDLLNDAQADVTKINFAPSDYANNVSYTGASPIAYSPIYKYGVTYDKETGMFQFDRASAGNNSGNQSDNFNPSALPTSVTQQAGAYTTQLQTFNYAFQHVDTFMTLPYLERMAIKNRNKYALSPTGDATDVGVFSPLFTKTENAGFWVKPYSSFENIPLNNGPKVSNINYGTLIGYDSELTTIAKGFDRVLTGYLGYNGASQRFQGVDSYQNGGILGGTVTLYKGNFFNATTLSVGASQGTNSGMYGSENYAMLLAGVGNKFGYNFETFKNKIIIQPSMLISYTFVNTFDYKNAAGVKISADPLNALQLAPGIKVIANLENGWQPYLAVNMIWNILDDTKVTANDVRLPSMSIDPYVEYGAGIQKRWAKKYTAYLQAMIRNGGRNGVSLTCGFRWAVGKK